MANTKIPSELIDDSAITATHLSDGTITPADIAVNAITTAKIADSNITTAKIGDAQVTTAKITDANVTTAKIADDAVTTAKMADNSVTSDTIASGITLAGTTTLTSHLVMGDNDTIKLGDLADLTLYHDASSSHIENQVGHFYLTNYANDSDIIFRTDDGSGGHTAYLTLDGSAGKAIFNKHTKWGDNVELNIGNDNDLVIKHNGSHSIISEEGTGGLKIMSGDVYIRNPSDADMIHATSGGHVKLYHSGSEKLATSSSGISVTGNAYIAGSVTIPDAGQAQFGSDNDMQIYHNGAQGEISVNTGDFTIDSANDIILDAGGQNWYFDDDGTRVFSISQVSSDVYIGTEVADKDMIFRVNDSDGGGTITALTLDGSAAGYATFNNYVKVNDRIVGNSNLILVSHDSNEKIQLDASGYIKLEAAGTERMRITASGASVTGTLDVSGAATVSSINASGGFLNGSNGGIRIHTGGTKFFNVTAANAARDNIMDVGASDARFKDGWFGGNVKATRFILDAPGSGATKYIYTDNTNTGTGRLAIQSGGGSAGYGGGLNLFSHSHASKPGWVTAGLSLDAGSTGASTEARFTVNTQGLAGGTDLFTVLRSGKVGIGTTSPAQTLSVNGTIGIGTGASVGIGSTMADANVAELGPGYLNLARDDTADAKQISFSKNGVRVSDILTTDKGIKWEVLESSGNAAAFQLTNSVGTDLWTTMNAAGHKWQDNVYNALSVGSMSIGSDSSNTTHQWWNVYDTGNKYGVSAGYGMDEYVSVSTGDYSIRMGSNVTSAGASTTLTERYRFTNQGSLNIFASGSQNETNDAKIYVEKNSDADWSMSLIAGADDYGIRVRGDGAYAFGVISHTANAYRARIHYDGYIYSSDGSIHDIDSDVRLKEEIVAAPSQWQMIKDLPLQKYKWKDRRHGDIDSYGWIAQEVEKKYPEFVEPIPQTKEAIDAGEEDPEYLTVKTGEITRRALAALQEAMTRIETLEARIKTLEG